MIKSLIYKDFKNIINASKGSSIYYVFLVVVYLGFLILGDSGQGSMILNIFLFSFFSRISSLEGESQGESYLSAAPLKKTTIVNSKFMIMAFMGVFALIVNSIFFLILKNFRNYGLDDYIAIIISQITITTIYSLYFPILFKYGYKKSAVPFIVIVFSVVGVIVLGVMGFIKLFPNIKPNDFMILSALLVLCLAVLAGSYLSSIKILEAKEY